MGGGGGYEPEESESRLALAEQAANQLKRYSETFVPLENMFIADAKGQFDDANYTRAMGRATSDAARIYERGLADQTSQSFQRGFDPSSGAFQGESAALNEAYARNRGLAGAGAGIANTDRGYQMLGNVVRMGQGLQTEAMGGLIDVAQNESDRLASQAEQDFMRSSSLQNLAGTGAGMAAGYGLNRSGGLYG